MSIFCDLVLNDVGKANLLNRTFALKFSDPAVAAFPNVPFSVENRLSEFGVSEEVVRDLLRELSVSKACGPYELSARTLLECADELFPPPPVQLTLPHIPVRYLSRAVVRSQYSPNIQKRNTK